MRRISVFLAILLCGCGGGASVPVFDPVVRVSFVDLPNPIGAQTRFEAGGTVVLIDVSYRDGFELETQLRHELWHAVTGEVAHLNGEGCVSASPAESGLFIACASEAEQMRAATVGGPRLVTFMIVTHEPTIVMPRAESMLVST